MEDRKHCDPRILYNEEDRIGKTMEHSTPDHLQDLRVLKWVSNHGLKGGVNGNEELLSEALNPSLVPRVGFSQIGFGLGANQQVMRHGQPGRVPSQ